MRVSPFLISILSLLTFSFGVAHCGAKARDANPIVRSDKAMAAGLYASAALESYGPITPAMVVNETETDLSLTILRGARVDVTYVATIHSLPKTVNHVPLRPVHYEGMRPVVPFAAAAAIYSLPSEARQEYNELQDVIEGIISFRLSSILRIGVPVKRRSKGKRPPPASDRELYHGIAAVNACGARIVHANDAGISTLRASLANMPAWPWGFPQTDTDKAAFRRAIADAFKAHSPTLPLASDMTEDWCEIHARVDHITIDHSRRPASPRSDRNGE